MSDLRRALSVLDGLEAPDLWRTAETRQPGSQEPQEPSQRKRIGSILVALAISSAGLALVVKAFYGEQERQGPGGTIREYAASSENENYEADVFVLDRPSHGPRICLSTIRQSIPPQCEGMAVTDWDWGQAEGEETAQGASWGRFHVVGTFEGGSFALAEEPTPWQGDSQADDARVETACPEPEGGWRPVDPGRATQEDLQAASGAASAEPDFSGLWIDYMGEPSFDSAIESVVLNVAFTGDLSRHETEIRQHWGGALCMVQHPRTLKRLQSIQAEVSGRVGEELGLQTLDSGIDEVHNQVRLSVVVIDEQSRAALDARYGEGAVQVTAVFRPVAQG